MKESICLTYSFCFLRCLLDRGHIIVKGGLYRRFTVSTAFMFSGNINLGKTTKAPLPKGGSARRAVGDSVALRRGSSRDDTREESPLPPPLDKGAYAVLTWQKGGLTYVIR